ncbi:MAG: rod shape-determining protein MreC [Elusimicrobia bacterium RIFOXYB2_FULL_48_7]|nr:MAG: rod shape-determining protein MreC [Elusimicrobia bacterium RIFOXYB2_FULL_48_7]
MKHQPTIVLILLISISLMLFVFDLTSKIESFKILFNYLLSPAPNLALKIINRQKELGEDIVSFVKIHQENRSLKEEINKLRYVETQNESLRKENSDLTSMLGLSKKSQQKMVAARVISRDPSCWYKTFIINKGRSSGINSNMPVIMFANNEINLVGRVADATKTTAKILLLTDSVSYVPVKNIRTQETGLIKGEEKSMLLLDYLLPFSDVRIGDRIVTSGIGEVFPEGLPVGVVHEVPLQDSIYYKKVLIRPLISWNKIGVVYILTK